MALSNPHIPALFAAAAGLLIAGACQAADASPAAVKRAFGNTIVSTYPDGRTALLWLHEDGGYSAKGRRRLPSSGTWSVKGDRVCLKQLKPTRGPFRYCTNLPQDETWTAKAVTGEPIKVRLVKGVREP